MSVALQEILVGPRCVKYGPLPKIELPGDDVLLLDFARQVLAVVKDKGIYRRDNVPVFPYMERGRLEIFEAQAFRSWAETVLVCFKTKFDDAGEPFDVLRTMNKETADGVLKCIEFWTGLLEIVTVNPVRLPSVSDNLLTLLEPGYDEKTKTLTFKGGIGR
jgi:hypothetical protein